MVRIEKQSEEVGWDNIWIPTDLRHLAKQVLGSTFC